MRFLLFCLALSLTACTHRVYEVADIDTITRDHHTIAVLLPKVDYKFANTVHEDWRRVPDKGTIAAEVQLSLVNWIRELQESGVLDITVIDVANTSELLAKDYSQIARELGVDAVMVSRLQYDTRMDYNRDWFFIAGMIPQSRIYLNLFSPDDGLIWSYRQGGHYLSNSYDRIVFDLLKYATNRMPYTVAK